MMMEILKALDNLLRAVTADIWFVTIDGDEVKEVG